MKILIEGERYPIDYLVQIFRTDQFYEPYGNDGKIKFVGYYHDLSNNELVFMLPKVFMLDCRQTVFNLTIDELIDYVGDESVIRDERLTWMRNLSVYFYKSLMKFRHKFPESTLINYSPIFQLKGINKTFQYSYLDILLSFLTYYKKNDNQILYKHIDAVQANPKKPKWEKTIRKGMPILIGGNIIYDRIRAKNKVVNNEEQLIIYFFSILNYLNEQHALGLHIDKVYPVIKGIRFRDLMKCGVSKLKKIKYRYYTDSLKEMHTLCMLFFDAHDQGRGKEKEDFMTISEYNIVFEDMVDNLFSDDIDDISANDINLNSLRYHKDGKILDHIFDHTSLFDDSSIFYIGDSKYYKSGTEAKEGSRFKQFTYAKNVIQYNIDLLNEKNRPYKANQQYRNELTEGYNITPNFFIYGYIDKPNDYSLNELKPNGEVQTSYHFRHRLFDRDTLFVHQYKINFLFVLKSYMNLRTMAIAEFRKHARMLFRDEFLKYFAEGGKSGYTLYSYNGTEDQTDFVNHNFKLLNGKIYQTIENELLLAVHKDDVDDKLRGLLHIFRKIEIH